MASGYRMATGWGNTPDFDSVAYSTRMRGMADPYAGLPGRGQGMAMGAQGLAAPGGGGVASAMSAAGGGAPGGVMAGYMGSPEFQQGQGWLDQLYGNRENQLRTRNDEQWREVAAARGLDPTDGPIVQGANSSLADQMANLDASRLEALLGMQANAQGLAWQQAQAQQADSRWKQEMAFQKQQYSDQQQAAKRAESLAAQYYRDGQRQQGGGGDPYAPNAQMTGPGGFDGQSGTGGIIGGPATGTGQDTRLGSERGIWAPTKAPNYSASNYETAAQAAERQAGNTRSNSYAGGSQTSSSRPTGGAYGAGQAAFDYSGSKNTGGHQVPGVSGAGPSVSSLQNAGGYAAQYAQQGAGSMAGGSKLPQYASDQRRY